MLAYKSILLACVFSFVMTSVLLICGDDLSKWLVDDPTVQCQIAELIPLLGIGNIVYFLSRISCTLIGSQGRYFMSNSIGVLGYWGVGVPLASICSILLDINLQGQMAALVFGSLLAGTVNSAFLLRSSWKSLSDVMLAKDRDDVVGAGDE